MRLGPYSLFLGPRHGLRFLRARRRRAGGHRLSRWCAPARCAPRTGCASPKTLESAGKEAVLSTLALIEAESDLGGKRRLARTVGLVEANDMGAVNLLAGRARFVAGPHLTRLQRRHARACSAAGGAPLGDAGGTRPRPARATRPRGGRRFETEVFVFGRLPSFSARCFTARAPQPGKDDCNFRCADYADGMLLATRRTPTVPGAQRDPDGRSKPALRCTRCRN